MLSPIKQIKIRSIPRNVEQRLIASSAGRCEFRGCNKDLFQHHITRTPGNFSEKAHIVAYQEKGPRGDEKRPEDINIFENLMLLCAECHHLVDNRPEDFPTTLLRQYKREHEERVISLTKLGPDQRTTIIQLRSSIGSQSVDIPPNNIQEALYPRYAAQFPRVLIDLSDIQRESPHFFDLARDQIRRELRPQLKAERESKQVQHYSVFALAPIPILVCLGRELGNKLHIDLFQRHRDHSWKWREEGNIVEYQMQLLRKGTDLNSVSLQLSLSGKISPHSIPQEIDDKFYIYEITLCNIEPGVEFLRRREDLAAFQKIYRDSLSILMAKHGYFPELYLFLAVPATIAISCGMEVMPKAHPALKVYDNVKGSFIPAITVNTGDDL